MNLTSFLEWPEGATNEQCDAQGLPTPVATCLKVRPKMTKLKRKNNQQCSTTAKGATPRSVATPSAWPATMKDSLAHHTSWMPDPVKQPREWVKVYIKGWGLHPHSGLRFLLWIRGAWERLPKWMHNSRPGNRLWIWLPKAQFKKAGWWDPSPSLHDLQCNKFLLPGSLMGSWDIWEMCKERTLALVKALQSYTQQSGGPYHVMCSIAGGHQACMTNLMWFREENVLDAMLFEPLDNGQLVSSNPRGGDHAPQWAPRGSSSSCMPSQVQRAGSQAQVHDWTDGGSGRALGHASVSTTMRTEPLPPKQDIPLIEIPNPNGSKSALTPVGAMSIVIYKNEVMGNLKYEYETHCLGPLCPELPNHRPKITKLWAMEWVFHTELCSAKWRLKNEDHSVALISLYQK